MQLRDEAIWAQAEVEAEKRRKIGRSYRLNLDAETQDGLTYAIYEEMTRRYECTFYCKACKVEHRKGDLVLPQADIDELWNGRAPASAYTAFHGHRDYRDRYATPADAVRQKKKKSR